MSSKREGLGEEFIAHVQRVLDKIGEDTLQYAIALRDIREAIVSKFPFAIYFRAKADRVVIMAVFHCSRNPSDWQGRN